MVSSLMFFKEKYNSTMKRRFYAYGSTQLAYIKQEDATSPTAHTKSVFITLVIAVHERRDQAVVDVIGAFLTTGGDEDVVMQLKGTLAKLMCKVDPGLFRKFITNNKKGKQHCMDSSKALSYSTAD